MFGGKYKSKLRWGKFKATGSGDKRAKYLEMSFHLEFTAELAEALGGKAVEFQKALATTEAGSSASKIVQSLDAEKTDFFMYGEKGKKLAQVNGCNSAVVIGSAPNAEDPNPTLEFKVEVPMKAVDAAGSIFERYLDDAVHIRLEKREGGLFDAVDGDGGDDAAGGE